MAMVMRVDLELASYSQDDLVEMQLLTERSAARKAASTATEADIAELRALIEQMQRARSLSTYFDRQAAFHVRMVRASENALAAALTGAMRQALRHVVLSCFEGSEDIGRLMTEQTAEHVSIVDAMAAHDGDLAAETVGRHLVGICCAMRTGKVEGLG